MTAQPEKIHVAKELKYGKPLVSCRFDPTGRFVFAGCEDDTVQRWDLKADPAKVEARGLHGPRRLGLRAGRRARMARRSSPAGPTAS